MNIKQIILILMLILVSGSVFGEVTNITINSGFDYINETKPIQFSIVGTFPATLHIFSTKDGNGIDFDVNSSPGTAIISLTATSASVNAVTGIPTIPVNAFDTVIIEDTDHSPSASLKMDSLKPNNSAVLSIVARNGNYLNFYSGKITVNYSAGTLTDSETYTNKHIMYLVPVGDINAYNSDYEKMYVDSNITATKDINSLTSPIISDGNYYVVIDVNDIAGNYSDSDDVINTKQNIYFDNTAPVISSVSVGTIASDKIYTDENTFDLDVVLSDASGIASGTLTVVLPNTLVSTDSSYSSGFSITEEDILARLGTYPVVSGDIFQVNINATDNVGNEYDYDFNIIADLTAPTVPVTTVTEIEDVDKNVTITWTASTDTGSALKEYKVYRGTSDFTTTVPSTLICTTTALTCLDDDEDKDLDETYFYGVVAIDNAGNISAANTDSVWTGPDCDIEINDGNDFTKNSTVNIELTYSNDVNEMAFSCNGTSFSIYEEADEDEDEKIFTITSGNGCSTTSEEKTIYARVRSENEPTRTTICSAEIYYDNVAPSVPTNITTAPQTNGSVRLSWTASTDQNTNSDIVYKIYYSLENNVTTSSSFLETDNTSYNHAPNIDTNVYYKLSAIDEAGNESALSSTIVGVSRRIGPDLTITIIPSNTSDEEIYVGAGIKTIKFVSDEALKSAPQVSVKQASDAFVTVPVIYNAATKSGQIDFNFTKSGLGIAKIVAINNSNETSTTELNFIIDTNVPDFNVDYNANESIFSFVISNYPQDIFRVQYILDNSDELCFKTKEDSNFNCVFDSIAHSDGNHIVSILVYDYALNINRKEVAIVIDNIDEDQVLSSSLKENIDFNIVKFKENLNLFEALRLLDDIDPLIKTDYELLLADISDADKLLLDENFTEAKEKYLLIKSALETLNNKLPEIEVEKLTSKEMIYDGNTTIPLNLVLDANVISETNELYTSNKIKITRDFEVLKINNKKYFSVTLKIKNESASEKTITTIEEVPKAFSTDIAFLSFTQPFEVLIKDPIFKFTMTIPAESERDFSYRYLKPITDVDLVTKTQKINFANSIVLNGTVPKEKLNVKKPIDKNIFIYLILIIVIFVFILIIVNAIANYTNKKVKVEIKPDSKKEMSDLLGDIKQENVKNEKLEETAKTVEEQKQNADKFQENYDFILSAIKKR